MNNLYFLVLGLAFVAAVTFVLGAFHLWNAYRGPEAMRTAERLRAISAGEAGTADGGLLPRRRISDYPVVEKALLTLPHIHSLDRFLMQTGTNLGVAQFLGMALLLAVASLVVAAAFGAPTWLGALVAGAAVAAWVAYVDYLRVKRMRAIDRQLPDMLDLMARAMQAGHAFSSALQLAAMEGPQPIATEFRTTFDELNFGMPLAEAAEHLASRVESADLRFFVVSVLIQQETGGNLAEILVSIAQLIRERQNLAAHIRVLSAEGRISAWVLGLMPFALGFAVWVINPPFISLLWTDPVGVRVLAFVIILMATGGWWMRQMVHFRT